jgi:hypothetical protein
MDAFVDALMDAIQSCCAPVFVCPRIDSPPTSVNDNGTCGFFDTGTHKLLITAQHVIESWREMERTEGNAIFAVNVGPGNTIALPHLQVIDEEKDFLDLAILEFPQLESCGTPCQKRYFPIRSFPPPLPMVGEALSLVGYPGMLRKTSEHRGSFSPVSIGYTISTVSERQIILADERGDRKIIGDQFSKAEEVPLGGFSGSPAFIIRQEGAHIAGFLRAGSKSVDNLPINLPGVIFVSPAICLNPDGTLDRGRMPWLHT